MTPAQDPEVRRLAALVVVAAEAWERARRFVDHYGTAGVASAEADLTSRVREWQAACRRCAEGVAR